MNCCNKIIMIWASAIIAVSLFWGTTIYNNGIQGKIKLKNVAIQTLKEVGELAVNKEFEKLGLSYSRWRAKAKHIKRLAITENGKFEILVDSLKETQGLYSLEAIGYKADVLNCYGKFPLKDILFNWKKRMTGNYGEVKHALSLEITPLGTTHLQKYSCGDTTIFSVQNKLASYYLDEMYTMTLNVFLQSTFWDCINWTAPLLLFLSLLLFFMVLGLIMWVINKIRKDTKTVEVLPPTIYKFGNYTFDTIQHRLSYKEEELSCTPQAARLLLAFAGAPDYLLTNDKIAMACGWSLDDDGINERRRKAINLLRKLFEADDSVTIIALSSKKAYQIVIYNK